MDISNDRFVRRIAAKSIGCGLLASVGVAIFWSISTGMSAATGVAIGVANLVAVAKISKAILSGDTEKKSVGFWGSVLFAKLLVLFGLTFVVTIVLGANTIAFCLGFTSFLLGILWEGMTVWLSGQTSKETQ
jgi:hypothetical protein